MRTAIALVIPLQGGVLGKALRYLSRSNVWAGGWMNRVRMAKRNDGELFIPGLAQPNGLGAHRYSPPRLPAPIGLEACALPAHPARNKSTTLLPICLNFTGQPCTSTGNCSSLASRSAKPPLGGGCRGGPKCPHRPSEPFCATICPTLRRFMLVTASFRLLYALIVLSLDRTSSPP